MPTLSEYEQLKQENAELRRENAELQRPTIDVEYELRAVLRSRLVKAYLGDGDFELSPQDVQRFDRQVNVALAWSAEELKQLEGMRVGVNERLRELSQQQSSLDLARRQLERDRQEIRTTLQTLARVGEACDLSRLPSLAAAIDIPEDPDRDS